MESSAGESIMSSLLRRHPSPPHLRSLAFDLRLRHRRLLFLLASPPQFSLALSHLRSLPLSSKSLLLSRLLLRSLSLLLLNTTEGSCSTQFPFITNIPAPLRLLDLDAAILLLAITDAYRPSAFPAPDWHSLISRRVAAAALSTAGLGAGWWPVIAPHLDYAVKCRRLTAARELTGGAAEAAAVMAMSAAEEGECAICGEEIAGGGAMPCGHPFHWKCILEWLRMRNTCPCCRFELPTVDVYGEIDRVWRLATEKV